jgi:hypothetical protein
MVKGKEGKTKRPELGDTPGSNVGPNAESKAAKRPRGATATPPSAEGPTKKVRSGTHRSEEGYTPVNPGTSTKGVSYRDITANKKPSIISGSSSPKR